MMEIRKNIENKAVELIKDKFKEYFIHHHSFRGDTTIVVNKKVIKDVIKMLKEEPELKFDMLLDLTAVDYLEFPQIIHNSRFEVVYHLRSSTNGARLRIKVPVSEEDCSIDSITSLFKIADWLEREVWDMFGIVFNGHPNLKRILLYEEFKGHPLRKDYPYNKEQPLFKPRDRSKDRMPIWVR